MSNKYHVTGVAFVPVEVEMVVFAENESEAQLKAEMLECENPFGDTPGRDPRLGDFVVPGSADEAAAFDLSINQIMLVLDHHLEKASKPATPLKPQSGELFYYKGRAAFVSFKNGKRIDWDIAIPAFAQAAGAKDPDDCCSVTLDSSEWIGGVPYTWGLAGANGACFRTYQLPEVPEAAVEFCRSELKRQRDVVGRIANVQLEEWIEFDCPHTIIP